MNKLVDVLRPAAATEQSGRGDLKGWLDCCAQQVPEAIALRLVSSGSKRQISYADLRRDARQRTAHLNEVNHDVRAISVGACAEIETLLEIVACFYANIEVRITNLAEGEARNCVLRSWVNGYTSDTVCQLSDQLAEILQLHRGSEILFVGTLDDPFLIKCLLATIRNGGTLTVVDDIDGARAASLGANVEERILCVPTLRDLLKAASLMPGVAQVLSNWRALAVAPREAFTHLRKACIAFAGVNGDGQTQFSRWEEAPDEKYVRIPRGNQPYQVLRRNGAEAWVGAVGELHAFNPGSPPISLSMRGKRLKDGSVAVLKEDLANQTFADGLTASSLLRGALSMPEVRDAAVVKSRPNHDPVLFVVPADDRIDTKRFQRALARLLFRQHSVSVCFVERFVHDSTGKLDELCLLEADRAPLAPASETIPSLAVDRPTEAKTARKPSLLTGEPFELDRRMPTTLVEALRVASKLPDHRGLWLIDADGDASFLSYSQLYSEAKGKAALLQSLGLNKGDVAIFQIEDQRVFFINWWGCILSGIRPIVVDVSATYSGNSRGSEKLMSVCRLFPGAAVVASTSLAPKLATLLGENKLQNRMHNAEVRADLDDPSLPQLAPTDVAFVQLTSGSTGTPKCVIETHQNIICHIQSTTVFNKYGPDDVTLNWLPLDHVAPLLMCHLKDLYNGCVQIHVDTARITAEPLAWCDYIERFKVTHTWSPNFGYRLLAEHLKNSLDRTWDLRSVRHFVNAGEQATHSTIEDFIASAGRFGVTAAAIRPAYGMAELSTAITYGSDCENVHFVNERSSRSHLELVSRSESTATFVPVGSPIPGVSVRIANDADEIVPEWSVGQVQVSGEVVVPGYWSNGAVDRSAFTPDGWFRTGDLGYVGRGELVITGRQKEIIIIRGVHYHCYEMEEAVGKLESVKAGFVCCTAATDSVRGTEGVAVFFVPEGPREEDERRGRADVQRLLAKRYHLNACRVVALREQDFPKTTSGKVQRERLRSSLDVSTFANAQEELQSAEKAAASARDVYAPVLVPKQRTSLPFEMQSVNALVVGPQGLLCHQLIESLRYTNADVSFVEIPDRPKSLSIHDFESQLVELSATGRKYSTVYFVAPTQAFCSKEHEANLSANFAEVFSTLLSLFQALSSRSGRELFQSIATLIICSHVPTDDRGTQFESHTEWMSGFLRTLTAELGWLQVRSVEVRGTTVDDAAKLSIAEAYALSKDELVVYRGRQRLVPLLKPVDLDMESATTPLRTGGNYLITGGCSGIARVLARHLAQSYRINVVFVGRRPLNAAITTELEWLKRIGVRACYAAADVGNRASLESALESAKQAGIASLDGAFHLASVFEQKSFQEESWDAAQGAYASKVLGTVTIAQFLRSKNPQALLVLFSSVNSYFGGLDAAVYSAVCGFQAEYARKRSQHGSLDVRCLAWTPWHGIGSAKGFTADQLSLIEGKGFDVLGAAEALVSLEEALCGSAPTLFVGLNKSKQTIAQHVYGTDTVLLDAASAPAIEIVRSEAAQSRDEMQTGIGPDAAILRTLRDTWESILGATDLAAEDNFFERGGNSLLASRLVAEVSKQFGVKVPLRQLFATPTITSLAAHLTECTRSTDRESAAETGQAWPSIIHEPGKRFEPFALNEIQQIYWIGRDSAFELGNTSAHVYLELAVGQLDVGRLSRAIAQIVERHDMLRAVVLETGQQQVLRDVPPFRVSERDLRWMSPSQVESALGAVRREMSHHVFDTGKWPLFDVRLSICSASRGILHFGFDVIIADAASLLIFARELVTLYATPEAKLPTIGLSFKDYLSTLDAFRRGQQYAKAWEYWSNRLPNLPTAPQLPLAKDPQNIGAPKFTRLTESLTEKETENWQEWCGRRNLTLSAGFLTAFAEVLQLWCKSESFCLNLTTFNRLPLHPDVDKLVGDFTTLTPTQIAPRGDRTFSDHASEVQAQLWSDLDNSIVGTRVLREIAAKRANKTSAPLPVVFTSTLPMTTNAQGILGEFGAIEYMITQTPQVWLDHQVFWDEKRIGFNWDFVEELFPIGMIETIFSAYLEYVRSLAADEGSWSKAKPFEALSCIRQRDNLLRGTCLPSSPPKECLHSRFLQWAASRPDREAVVTSSHTISYGVLEYASRILSRRLQAIGIGSGGLVAIAMEKGWEQVVAALAVLRAGAAYVPIDAAAPVKRARKMLEISGASCVLKTATDMGIGDVMIPALAVTEELLNLSEAGTLVHAHETLNGSTNLAYVIFTSGSTGEPKGVAISHGAALNTIDDINRRFGVNCDDALFGLSSLTFDLSVYDIFGALSAGAKLVLPDAQGLMDPGHWMSMMKTHSVTVWNSVPALMHLMVDFSERTGVGRGDFDTLRLALISGDWIPLNLAERIRRQYGQRTRVIGLGGATEASIWSNFHEIEEVDPRWASIPYGKALANQSIFVLDEALQPGLIGQQGNIYIGGVGLADGYWKDPQRTAASFTEHPSTGARLYATGDLGRFMPDGSIEFLGRQDNQVKIRGYRVELGEIEAAIVSVSGAAAAVVNLAEYNGKTALAGYLTTPSKMTDKAKILEGLRALLPAYMVPDVLIWIESVPLTANGKVDRRALPVIDMERDARSVSGLPSIDSFSQEVTHLVSQAIGVANLAARDNLLEVGANSIDLVRALTALQARFGFRISIGEVYRNPTIDHIVALIRTRAVATKAGSMSSRGGDIQLVSRESLMPLSFGQERIWYMQHKAPDIVAYNEAGGVRLKGHIDPTLLRDSLSYVFQRHEAFRTLFVVDGDDVYQKILLAARVDLSITDLSHVEATQRSLHLREFVRSAVRQKFDLTKSPPIKVHLIKVQSNEHILLAVIHHIIADGWSVGILVKDLVHVYTKYARNEQPTLTVLPLQYCDYATWQRKYFGENAHQESLSHWERTLRGMPILKLPLDSPRPRTRSYNGDKIDFAIDEETTALLRKASARHGVSLFVSLITVYATLLARFSGQEDFGIGTIVAGRDRPEFMDVVGCFVNALTLRADFAGAPTLGQMLSRMKQVCVDAFANQEVPFEKVVEVCAGNRDAGIDPLWQAMFILHVPQETLSLPGLEVEPFDLEVVNAKFDLKLDIYEDGKALRGSFISNKDILRRESLEQFVEAWLALINHWPHTSDDAPVAQIPLVSVKSPASADPATDTETVVDNVYSRFESCARKYPERIAVLTGATRWKYSQLNRRVDAIAGALARLAVTDGDIVAICMENPVDFVATILAAMKLGCAYLPLDAKCPPVRVLDQLKRSRAALLVGDSRIISSLVDVPVRTVALEDVERGATTANDKVHLPRLTADATAYVVFTSGSTGNPKGVAISHAQLLNYVDGVMPRLGLPDGASMALASTLAADLGHTCTFGALTTGRCLNIVPAHTALDPNAMAAYMRHTQPEFFKVVPSHLAMLLEAEVSADVLPTSCLMLAGEQLTTSLAQRVHELSAGLRIINSYGPSETTCGPFIHEFDPSRAYSAASVPIGLPLPNMDGVVCDEDGRRVPDNVVGELHIGGVGVCSGYLEDEEATSAAFIRHAVRGFVYRTGDRVRRRTNGELEFIGRVDNQIKVRGYRVELEEIERVAATYLRDRPCAACYDHERSELGIFIACSPEDLNTAEFAEYLERSLPSYMQPSLLGYTSRLPATLGGKLDRQALSRSMGRLSSWRNDIASTEARPQSALQRTVHDVFCEVLKVPQVDVNATFFSLGGHSLLAVKVVNALRERLRVQLPLSELFEHPTVLGLSTALERQQADQEASRGLELRSIPRNGNIPLSLAQERLWRINQSPHQAAILNTAGGLRIRGALNVDALQESFRLLIDRHEAFRTSFVRADKAPVANLVTRVAWSMISRDLSQLSKLEQASEVEKTWLEQVNFSFDLRQAPLLRAVLLRAAATEHVLILSMNHIITDAVSMDIFLRELAVVYSALRDKRSPSLPTLRFQYADFAAAQRSETAQQRLAKQRAYWLRELKGWEYIDLFADRKQPDRLNHAGAHVRSFIDGSTTALIRMFAQNEGLTEAMVLLAAFVVLLYRHSGQADIVTGVPYSVRGSDELDNIVGYFINPLSIRIALGETLTCGELLHQVKRKVLAAQAHAELPFDSVVEAVTEQRLPDRQPVFQVVFNYLKRHRLLELPDLEIELLDFQRGVSPYELTLHLVSGASEIDCRLEYSAELFFGTTAEAMMTDYVDGLRRIMSNPEAELMDVISPSDRLLRGELAGIEQAAV
ncbi:amino acid adenylation domain-containing protein [Bradyrhizobium sp. USDA 4506]